MSTATFRVSPLPAEVARAARTTGRDAAGHEVPVVRDGKPHQCRVCLDLSHPDESVLLVAHRPFASVQPYAEMGPIFVHQRECDPYAEVDAWPARFPRNAVVLRGYSAEDRIEVAETVGERPAEQVVREMFANPAVCYLHARNRDYGCFMFRIDRP